MQKFRLAWLALLPLAAAIGGSPAALAQPAFPARPVTLVVPFVAGGGTDAGARMIAQKLTEKWGQSVVVDNRGGAGGIVGVDLVARAKPDGYTLADLSPRGCSFPSRPCSSAGSRRPRRWRTVRACRRR